MLLLKRKISSWMLMKTQNFPMLRIRLFIKKYGDNLLNCITEEKLFKRKYVISTRMHIKSIVQINYSEGKIKT